MKSCTYFSTKVHTSSTVPTDDPLTLKYEGIPVLIDDKKIIYFSEGGIFSLDLSSRTWKINDNTSAIDFHRGDLFNGDYCAFHRTRNNSVFFPHDLREYIITSSTWIPENGQGQKFIKYFSSGIYKQSVDEVILFGGYRQWKNI